MSTRKNGECYFALMIYWECEKARIRPFVFSAKNFVPASPLCRQSSSIVAERKDRLLVDPQQT